MAAFVAWYLILTLLGWVTFPLVFRLFPAMADRGYTLARAAGLLLWAYAFWIFTSFGISSNSVGGILFGLLPLLAASIYALVAPAGKRGAPASFGEMGEWLRRNVQLVITTEVLFLVAFALLALLRAGNPTLDNAEKPMELMFINAILRSPTFPPHDGWLSGYAISYYYFGYVMTAMLAQLTGITGSIAHNLMTALVFALAAVGSYGILFNLLSRDRQAGKGDKSDRTEGMAALLAPLFMLIVSNTEGFLEVLHRAGLFWRGTSNFWTWLDIQDLNQAPAQPYSWIPDRFWWWWRASRVISDYDLPGKAREVIDEFPFFSFLHADLHPHVLAIPFILLTLAVALNIFLDGWRGQMGIRGITVHLRPVGFAVSALVLGGLAFLNSWDILLGATLLVIAYGLMRVRQDGWSWERVVDMITFAIPLGIAAVLLYLPFYFGFASQAGGLLPNIVSPTRGAQLWVMWAPMLLPLLIYFLYVWRGERQPARWRLAILISAGFVLALWAIDTLVALSFLWREPGTASNFLADQGALEIAAVFAASMLRRLHFIGGLLTMLAVLIPAVAFMATMRAEMPAVPVPAKMTKRAAAAHGPMHEADIPGQGPQVQFVLILIIVGAVLLIGPEFVYLRDQFGYRLNTIFKFYFQAWLLWSIAAAYAVVILLRNLRKLASAGFIALLTLLLAISLTYPALAVANKTNNFHPPLGWTLDDFKRIDVNNPDEAAAIVWLKTAPDGVVAEAVGGSYSDYGRISVYTGLPTVLGWPGHESQWRGKSDPQGSRKEDIKQLYETADWEAARQVIERYGIGYIYVGTLERSSYQVQEDKFLNHLSLVFQKGAVSIYEVP